MGNKESAPEYTPYLTEGGDGIVTPSHSSLRTAELLRKEVAMEQAKKREKEDKNNKRNSGHGKGKHKSESYSEVDSSKAVQLFLGKAKSEVVQANGFFTRKQYARTTRLEQAEVEEAEEVAPHSHVRAKYEAEVGTE